MASAIKLEPHGVRKMDLLQFRVVRVSIWPTYSIEIKKGCSSDSQIRSWQEMKSQKDRPVLLQLMHRKLHLLLIGQVPSLKFKQKQTQKNQQPNKNQLLNSKRSQVPNLQPFNKNLEFKYSQTHSFATTFSSQGPQSRLLAE